MIKFDCGCVALPMTRGTGSDEKHLIISACDATDETSECLRWRNMTGKSFEPVPTEEENRIIEAVNRLIDDGSRYRHLRHLLQIPEVPLDA